MAPDAILASDAPVAGKPRPARRSPHGQVRSPLNPISGVALHPAGHGSLPSRRAAWPSAPRRPPALGRVRDRIVGPVERGNTTEPIPLISPASASEPSQDVHTTWLREISRLADGHRRGRPYGRTGSFVIRFPANPDGWTTADDHRNACGHAVGPAVAVRQGVRSRRPADQARVSIWDGCPGGCPSGCPSGCPAVGSEWESDRLSCLEGAGERDERVLAIGEAALGPDHPAVATYRGNLGNVLQALGDLEGARAQYERMLTVSEAALGPDHPTVVALRDTSTACSGPSKRRLLKVQPRLSSVVAASGRTQPTARAASLMPKHTCFIRSSSSTCAAP
ncbi:MAG: ATP/GTP-binding protein [Actinomycetia bacterium]|jgi:hypothetical protein|nr:ATP/GTP-binding protein [Actinomycetes bacterium]